MLVKVEKKEDEEPKKYRVYVNVSETRKSGVFINIQKAMQDETTRAVVLGAALHELKSFQIKYATYTELSKVLDVIDEYVAEASD